MPFMLGTMRTSSSPFISALNEQPTHDGDYAALARYAAGECSLLELGRILGITRREVRAELERTGITVRQPGRPSGSSRLAGILTEDYLRREVLGRCRGVGEVAAEVGCTPKTVRRYLRTSGILNRAPVPDVAVSLRGEEVSAPGSGGGEGVFSRLRSAFG